MGGEPGDEPRAWSSERFQPGIHDTRSVRFFIYILITADLGTWQDGRVVKAPHSRKLILFHEVVSRFSNEHGFESHSCQRRARAKKLFLRFCRMILWCLSAPLIPPPYLSSLMIRSFSASCSRLEENLKVSCAIVSIARSERCSYRVVARKVAPSVTAFGPKRTLDSAKFL